MDCWAVCFWGANTETEVDCYLDAFAESSSKDSCIAAWEDVGAFHPTCACFNDKQVWRELGDTSKDDMSQITMMEMQMANTMASDLLMAHDFHGNLL